MLEKFESASDGLNMKRNTKKYGIHFNSLISSIIFNYILTQNFFWRLIYLFLSPLKKEECEILKRRNQGWENW
jgi:hypothetical protein